MEKPQVTVLENGLTVVTRRIPGELQTLANVSVHVGSRHETDAESGMCHFLEHMLASDTERLQKDEKQVRIKNMRGTTNANTGFEQTQYYIHAGKEHTSEAIQMLAEGIQTPLMDPDRIEKERGAIISEIKGRTDDPNTQRSFMNLGTAFAGTGLGRYIGGTPEVVAGFTREQLLDFKDRYYTSDNMVLTVVGDVDHAEIVAEAEKHFDKIERSTDPASQLAQPARYRGGYSVRDNANMNQLGFTMSFEAASSKDIKAQLEQTVLGSILGGDMSSRLMRNLRGEKGLVYFAQAGSQPFEDNGNFLIVAGFDAEKGEEAIKGICEELVKAAGTLTQEEFEVTKNAILGGVERSKNDVDGISDSLVTSLRVHGRPVTIEEKLEILESITLDDLKARAAEIFAGAPTIAALGKDASTLPSYETITEWLGNRRELDASGLVKETAPKADRAVADAELAAAPVVEQRRAVG